MTKHNSQIVSEIDDIETNKTKHGTCNLSEQFANVINKAFFW